MKTLHFKEIDTYMKEYWKTHTIVPPCENDPLYIAGRIKENLTMNEKLITIILENYNKEKITFTMSGNARVETFLEINGSRVVGINIKASDEDIEIEKEEFTE